MSALLAAAVVLGQPVPSRWETAAPFPGISWIKTLTGMQGAAIANREATRLGLQARILWLDGSANIGPMGSEAGVAQVINNAADAGFNTVVYDVKPIVGRTMYPSKLTDQLTSWKGISMPAGFDPLKALIPHARRRGLTIFVALNAFSEGHSYSKRDESKPDTQFGEAGWGYKHPELQSVRYDASPVWNVNGASIAIHPTITPAEWTTPLALYNRIPNSQRFDRAFVLDGQGSIKSSSTTLPATLAADETLMLARGMAADQIAHGFGQLDSFATYRVASDQQNQIPLMMNPHDKRNQERAFSFATEVMTNYEVDGLLYDDRLRFGGFDSDFSESTRAAFEKYAGKKLTWPDDVYKVTYSPRLTQGFKPGPYFDSWIAWRAQEMKSFVNQVRSKVKQAKGRAMFGIYAGSWYGDYPKYGANYGSDELRAGFPFMTAAYRDAGFAKNLDLLITGCYYPVPTVYQATQLGAPTGRTVEAAGIISQRVARDQTWTVGGIMIADYWNNPKALEHSLQAAAATTQGVMVFDYSHRIEEYLPMLQRAFKQPAKAPYQVPGLLDEVRRKRRDWDAKGYREGPFPLFEGAPGAGF